MSTYRWNVSDFASAYDAAADHIHPYYQEVQDAVLAQLPALPQGALLVDAGGGSGRLVERFLQMHPHATGAVVDQSEPFLALAERRLAPFGGRATVIQARLQDDWLSKLPTPTVIVSTSAIHHLAPTEKQSLYSRCYEALASGGGFVNGDEVRPASDQEYLRLMQQWGRHMFAMLDSGSIPDTFRKILESWRSKNLDQFGQPKVSGDDCHETLTTQFSYLQSAGFAEVDCRWRKDMWAVFHGVKL